MLLSDLCASRVGGFATPEAEDAVESLAELSAHDAVKNKINGAVYQHDDVPNVAQGYVDSVEYRTIDAAE